MGSFDWVRSAGGALICIADDAVETWGGILRLTVPDESATNDYERTYTLGYAAILSLQNGQAMMFGEEPLTTSFWLSNEAVLFVVSIYYCEEWADDRFFNKIMNDLRENVFDAPVNVVDFDVSCPKLVMFDSANPGTEIIDKILSVKIEPGRYRIRTQLYDPDPTCSLVLHRFDKLT